MRTGRRKKIRDRMKEEGRKEGRKEEVRLRSRAHTSELFTS